MADVTINDLPTIAADSVADQLLFWDASGALSGKATFAALLGARAGNFTPTISFNGLSVGVTYNGAAGQSQYGRWIRLGSLVFAQARITLTSKGSSTGTMRLEGLPFTVMNVNIPGNVWAIGISGATANLWMMGLASQNYALLYKHAPSAGTSSGVSNTDMTDTAQIYWSLLYETNEA